MNFISLFLDKQILLDKITILSQEQIILIYPAHPIYKNQQWKDETVKLRQVWVQHILQLNWEERSDLQTVEPKLVSVSLFQELFIFYILGVLLVSKNAQIT